MSSLVFKNYHFSHTFLFVQLDCSCKRTFLNDRIAQKGKPIINYNGTANIGFGAVPNTPHMPDAVTTNFNSSQPRGPRLMSIRKSVSLVFRCSFIRVKQNAAPPGLFPSREASQQQDLQRQCGAICKRGCSNYSHDRLSRIFRLPNRSSRRPPSYDTTS